MFYLAFYVVSCLKLDVKIRLPRDRREASKSGGWVPAVTFRACLYGKPTRHFAKSRRETPSSSVAPSDKWITSKAQVHTPDQPHSAHLET